MLVKRIVEIKTKVISNIKYKMTIDVFKNDDNI